MIQVMDKAKKGMVQGKAKDMVRTIQKGVDHQKVLDFYLWFTYAECLCQQVAGIAGGYHGYTEEEKRFYASFINSALAGDPQCQHFLPIDLDGDALFQSVHDGILAWYLQSYWCIS